MQKESNLNLIWGSIAVIIILVAVYFLTTMGKKDMPSDMGVNPDGTSNTANNSGNTTNSNQPQNNNTNTPVPSDIPSDSMIMSLVNVSSIRVPQTGVDIAFSSGASNFKVGSVEGKVSVGSLIGKYLTEDGYDVLVNLTVVNDISKSTSQPVNYVALYHLKNGKVAYTSAVRIGDNIQVKSADAKPDTAITIGGSDMRFDSLRGYDVTVNYLGRTTGQPTNTAPTVSQSTKVNVKKHIITL